MGIVLQQTLITALFFLWGAANNLNDILIKQFQKAFTLNDMGAGLVQSAFYLGYFVGALPAARVGKVYGFKVAILIGLGLFALGACLFFPVSQVGTSYFGFLVCLYLIAFGLAFLESSANPWIVLLGDLATPGSGTRALNFAQSFNPLGSIVGVLVGRFFILGGRELNNKQAEQLSALELADYQHHQAAAVGMPFLTLGAVVTAILFSFAFTEFPNTKSQQAQGEEAKAEERLAVRSVCGSALKLWQNRGLVHGVLAQFFYVGAQVCVWSYLIRLAQANIPGMKEQQAADLLLVSLVLFVAGRFVATVLMKFVDERLLLLLYAASAAACCAIAALFVGLASVLAVCASSFFMSMVFPTNFGLTLATLDKDETEVGASLLVMSIIGGAVITPLMGVVSDNFSINIAYLIPSACLVVVALHAAQHWQGWFEDEEWKSSDNSSEHQRFSEIPAQRFGA